MSTYLGQNFLKDRKYINFILEKLKDFSKYYDTIVEIWPGEWAITKYLKKFYKKIILFEKDSSLPVKWDWFDKEYYSLYLWDFLQQDLKFIFEKENIKQSLIFGNLPYYITSPIFRKIVENYKFFPKWFFMIQKEVAEKIVSNASKKSFLRWIVNYYYNIKYIKTVHPKAFSPIPKVYSSLILFERKNEFPNVSFDSMIKWLDKVSRFKRKTLAKIYKINEWNIDSLPEKYYNSRLENLDFDDLENIISN